MSSTEPTAVSIFLDTISLIFNAIISVPWLRYLAVLGRILVWPLRILLMPVAFLFRVLLYIFSPVIHLVQFIASCCSAVLAFAISLEPLYNFFAVAACVGIITGLVLGVSSNFVTSHLGMDDDPQQDLRLLAKTGVLRDYPNLEEDTSSNETEWRWLEPSPSRRRPASGLMSQTIHEEEDDDSEGAF